MNTFIPVPDTKFCLPKFVVLFLLLLVSGTAISLRAATRVVPAGGDISAAIAASQCGDTIALQAGATFEVNGSLRLPDQGGGCTQDTTLTTTDPSGTPPALSTAYPNSYSGGVFTRVTPAMAASMPKLVGTSTLGTPVILFLEGAHHWKIVGMEITTNGQHLTTALVGSNDSEAHHITFDQNFLHPFEEVGDITTNIAVRSTESAFILNGHHFTWTHNAIQGFTGHAPAANGGYRLNANSILVGYLADSLIENNLLEANGQLFFSGGGGVNPAHQATATNVTFTSATFSNTTDLDVGDYFAIYSRAISDNHHLPHPDQPDRIIASEGHYINGKILSVNHSTGAVTFTHLTAGLDYRAVNLNLWGATGGSYTLTFQGQTTEPLAWNASFGEITGALEALPNLESNQFVVSQGIYAPILIRIGINSLGQPVGPWQYPTPLSYDPTYGSPLVVNGANLTGGIRSATATIKPGESYRPVEGSVTNALADAPDEGADVRWEGTQSHNIMIRRNIIAHHPEWTAVTGSVKGFAEVKGGDHVTFDGNIFSGEGTTIIWTVRNQGDGGSSPWSEVSYAQVTNNIFDVTGFTNAFSLEDGARENTVSHDILLHNNLFLNPDYRNQRPWIKVQSGYNVTITHNTVFAGEDLIYGVSYLPTASVTVKDNIFRPSRYPAPCTDGPSPCWPSNIAARNLILNDRGLNPSWMQDFFSVFGAGAGWIENSLAAVGFTNASSSLDSSGNYRLRSDSLYHAGNARQASDGKDVGVDFDQLYYAIYGVGTPPPPTPTPTPLPTSTPTPTPIPTPSPGGAIPVQGYVFGNNVRLGGATVMISVGGNVQQTKTTDQFGFYSFNSVATGSTVVPSAAGYNFAPMVTNSVTANYNFNGTTTTPTPTPTPSPGTTVPVQGYVFGNNVRLGGATVMISVGGNVQQTKTTDQFGFYSFNSVATGSTVVPSAAGYNFAPMVTNSVTANYNFNGTTTTPTPTPTPSPGGAIPVQGYVFGNNVRLGGATVMISVGGNVQQTKTTDQFGFYSFNSVATGSTVVPSAAGYNFAPMVTNSVTANYNFNGTTTTPTPTPTPSPGGAIPVQGYVFGNNVRLSGATVMISVGGNVQQTKTTDQFGFYSFNSVATGSTVVPSAAGYNFAPMVTNSVTANYNFNGTTTTPTPTPTPSPGTTVPVQGYVFGNNVRLSGAIVTISVAGNAQQTKITDQFGFYSFNSVATGSTIVPSIDGYNFSPEVVNALTTNYNFNGTTTTPTPTPTPSPGTTVPVQGYVFGNNVRLSGAIVTISVAGNVQQTKITDQFGFYSFNSVAIGSTVVPSIDGYNFSPEVVNGLTANYNFNGTPVGTAAVSRKPIDEFFFELGFQGTGSFVFGFYRWLVG